MHKKTNICTFATLLLILNSSSLIITCFAQWVQMSNGVGNYKFVYAIASSGNNIFEGCHNNQGIYLSTNNGQSWTQTALNNKSVTSIAIIGNYVFAGVADS